jgi:glutaredoxin
MNVRELLVAALLAACGVPACSNEGEGDRGAPAALPDLVFRDDTPSLILTWLDATGSAHVGAAPGDVPDDAKRFVRVVVGDRDAGQTDPIYVSNLTERSDDGSYTARSVPRREWEAEIERRRRASPIAEAERLDPPPRPPADRPRPEPSPAPEVSGPKLGESAAHVSAIVYGAQWCGPCHDALAHLKRRGVKSEYKDIDKDAAAKVEMKAKLSKVGRRDGAIPVIDVGGQILVGFSARALDQALEKAAGGTIM